MIDQMKCPNCGGTATRDPENRVDRFVCSCGWRSWETRFELLQQAMMQETEVDGWYNV